MLAVIPFSGSWKCQSINFIDDFSTSANKRDDQVYKLRRKEWIDYSYSTVESEIPSFSEIDIL